jgi:hypothetical protein
MKRQPSTLVVLAVLALASLPILPPSATAAYKGPLLGVHTIRADDALLQVAKSGGFTWLIQLLEWREVEPAPGEYFWEYPDWLVRAAEYYDLDLVLRLDHPPDWALTGKEGLPFDAAAYASFAKRVAARYQGQVTAYVIWNEPNLTTEWNGQPPDPEAYVRLLCSTQTAIRQADPGALIVSAGLAPTNHTDASALDDRIYLQRMYAADAAACFDILGAHPYGFAYPPNDPYGSHESLNFSRLADLRTIMVEAGDGGKSVWATEMGWTTAPARPEQMWLRVSEEEQKDYLIRALQQAEASWPWLERMAVWNLSIGLPENDEKRGFSLLAGDGSPKPAFEGLAAAISTTASRERPAASQGRTETRDLVAAALAPDVVVRLSDVDTYYPHWARPHCNSAPCRAWSGEFYVQDPGTSPWLLCLEAMQVEEPGNLVWINGTALDPPSIPLRSRPDFASVWTKAEITVPAALLRAGVNLIEVQSSPRQAVYQDSRARYESLQLRNVRLQSRPSMEP